MRHIIHLILLSAVVAAGCATHKQADEFSYPASQAELRLRLAQTLEIAPFHSASYEVRVYVVQVGDSLTIIATRLHVSEQELEALNPGADLQLLKVGQRLVFYERISNYTD
jgi:LysM domain-containing protein